MPPVPVVKRGQARVAVVKAKPLAAAVEHGEAARRAQVDGAVAARIAGQRPPLERTDVQAPACDGDVVEQHARHDLEVAKIDELDGDAVACPERVHHGTHAERFERRLELSALERRLRDRDRPVPVERPPREVDERPDDGGMGAATEKFVLPVAVVEVPGAHEVGLDDDVLPGPDEGAEGIPFGPAGVLRVEAQPREEPEYGIVDGVRTIERRRQWVRETGVVGQRDAFAVQGGRQGRMRAYQRHPSTQNRSSWPAARWNGDTQARRVRPAAVPVGRRQRCAHDTRAP